MRIQINIVAVKEQICQNTRAETFPNYVHVSLRHKFNKYSLQECLERFIVEHTRFWIGEYLAWNAHRNLY